MPLAPLLFAAVAAAPVQDQQEETLASVRARFETATREYFDSSRTVQAAWEKALLENPDAPRPEFPPQPYGAFYADYRRFADAGELEAKAWIVRFHRFSGLRGEEGRVDKRRLILQCLAEPTDSLLLEIDQGLRLDGFDVVPRSEAVALQRLMVCIAEDPETQAQLAIKEPWTVDAPGAPLEERTGALDLYREVAGRWPDTVAGSRARAVVVDAMHLQPGQSARPIEGVSVTGEKVSLTGLRGKVVVVYFWGFG